LEKLWTKAGFDCIVRLCGWLFEVHPLGARVLCPRAPN